MSTASFLFHKTASKLTALVRKMFVVTIIFTVLCMASQSYCQQYAYPPDYQQPVYPSPSPPPVYRPAYQQPYAAPNVFIETFRDAFYGGAVGALIGGSLAILTHQPGKHLDRIGYGFGAGVLLGSVYGVARSSRQFALANIENGKLAFSMPTIQQDTEKDYHHSTIVSAEADLLKVHF